MAQPAASAILSSGNYLFVTAALGLDVTILDPHLGFVSENSVGAHPSGRVFQSVILADVNGDGKLDLIAQFGHLHEGIGTNEGGVQLFLGDGLGGFQPAGSIPLEGFINGSMAVGDINGDGKPDLVIGLPPASFPGGESGEPAGGIVVALGKGDGTFVTSILPTPNLVGPSAIAIADLNSDGKNDLVFLTAPLTAAVPFVPDVVAVMLGKGDGTFSPQAVFPASVASFSVFDDFGTPGAVAVGDMNGDGIPDIVTNGISILFGDGRGGFPITQDFANTAAESVILTDFDGDGKMDVLIGIGDPTILGRGSTNPGENFLMVALGDGAGRLAAAPFLPSPTPGPPRSNEYSFATFLGLVSEPAMSSSDFNKDGVADLAFVSEFQYLSVFLGSKNGTLASTFNYDFTTADQQAYPTSVVAADFNQDGIPDLAVTIARPTSDGSLMLFLGKADGTFLASVSTRAPGLIWSLVTGDFNQDGHPDLAAIRTNPNFAADEIVVFLGQGDGSFASAKSYPAGLRATSLAAGDFNQDGTDDIAIANQTGINLWLGNTDGTLSSGTNIPFQQYTIPMNLAAADLNGDGTLDLVASAQPQSVAILFGNGDGTFLSPATYVTNLHFNNAPTVAVGDINGDGIPDIFLSSAIVLIGNGDGTFQLQTPNLPPLIGSLLSSDFNGDGKMDLAIGAGLGAGIFSNLSHPTALLSLVSAADFSHGAFAPHSIASAFGNHLALSTASASPPSLPSTLAGATVSVEDQTGKVSQAEIYFASPGQVNFVLPAEIEAGTGIVTIQTTDGQSASTQIQIAPLAPTIFMADPSGIPTGYAVRVSADNVQIMEPIFTSQGGTIHEVPIDLSTGNVYLVLFGTGFDAAPFGAEVEVGNLDESASYAGPQGQFPGLDQVNFLLPKALAGKGRTSVELSFVVSTANFYITIK